MWSREEAVRFFSERAAFAVPVGGDDEEVERRRMARGDALAEAERALRSGPFWIGVETDPEGFDGDTDWDGPVYIVTLYDVTDDVTPKHINSLGGVCAESENDECIRVVSAELMDEHLSAAK